MLPIKKSSLFHKYQGTILAFESDQQIYVCTGDLYKRGVGINEKELCVILGPEVEILNNFWPFRFSKGVLIFILFQIANLNRSYRSVHIFIFFKTQIYTHLKGHTTDFFYYFPGKLFGSRIRK